jgi:hypothetical protein
MVAPPGQGWRFLYLSTDRSLPPAISWECIGVLDRSEFWWSEILTRPLVTGSDSPNNPWAEIDALYRSRFPDDPPLDRSSRLRIELEDDDRRDFAHRLRQPWRPLSELNQITNRLRPGSNETMGCTWSEDGRIL